MNRIGFAGGGPLFGEYSGEPTTGDFDPGNGLSILTRTNEIATRAAWGGGANPSGTIPYDSMGAIGYGGAAVSSPPAFDVGMGIGGGGSRYVPSNLSGMGDDTPGAVVRDRTGAGSARMQSESAAMGGNPIFVIVCAVVAVYVLVKIYRAFRGHDGTMHGGATFLLIDVPFIVAAIWVWRWVGGIGVAHNVPYSSQVTAFFAA